MADFTEAIQRQKADRSPTKQATSFSDFCDLKDTVAEGITGISNIELKTEIYKTTLNLVKNDEVVGKVSIEIGDEDGYDTLLARINQEIAEEAMGADADFVEDSKARNWQLKYTGKDGDDTFNIDFIVNGKVITAKIDNYINDSTYTKMETWADTVAILSDGVES